jgi:hypothetical protein
MIKMEAAADNLVFISLANAALTELETAQMKQGVRM